MNEMDWAERFLSGCVFDGQCLVRPRTTTRPYCFQLNEPAARVMYRAFVGGSTDGMEVHHLCENPLCLNPEHLQAVTRSNHKLAHAPEYWMTHCKRGHPLVEGNLKKNRNQPHLRGKCLICYREKDRESKRRRRLDPEFCARENRKRVQRRRKAA